MPHSCIVADTTVHCVSETPDPIANLLGGGNKLTSGVHLTFLSLSLSFSDQATFSKRCYPRTALPGCKGKLFRFEKEMLHQIAMATFAVVPVHLFNIFIGLLCSNHVNRTFGKGLMPRQYRLRWV